MLWKASSKMLAWPESLTPLGGESVLQQSGHTYSVFQVGYPEEIKKWKLSLFVQVTTAAFISSGFHLAVVTCTNKDNFHFLSSGQPT